MYERRHERMLTPAQFFARWLWHFAAVTVLMLASLGGGMLGYNHFENLAWPDAFLNASMLLGGMGPVDAPKTEAGKLFAGFYALYAGLVFIVAAGVLLAPVIHRLFHHVNRDLDADS